MGFLARARREKKLCILTIIATRSNAWLSALYNVLDCFAMGRAAYKPDTGKNKRAADNLHNGKTGSLNNVQLISSIAI